MERDIAIVDCGDDGGPVVVVEVVVNIKLYMM